MNKEIDYDKELEDAAFAFNPPYMVLTEEDKKKLYEMVQMVKPVQNDGKYKTGGMNESLYN